MRDLLKQLDQSYTKLPVEIKGSRWFDLPVLFKELGFKVGVEIGVERGLYSKALSGRIPDLKLYCIDPWRAYSGYREHVNQERLDGFYKETQERLLEYNCEIIRKTSEEAVKDFADESLDFVYIDGNHEFLYVAQDISWWSKKVRKGGIVAGHDFRRNSEKYINDVKDVIPAFMYAKKIKPWYVLVEKEEAPSWFYIKL